MSTYDAIVERLQLLCEVPLNNSDSAFQGILPQALAYADNRIYRELDPLAVTVSNSGSGLTALTAGSGRFSVPTQFINVRYLNLISPAGTTAADAATRKPLERVSPEFMDFCFPSDATSGTSLPSRYAMYGTTANNAFSSTGAFTIRVAPAPTTAYGVEIVGPVRPTVFSQDNPDTMLTTRYPDLYIAACMVFLSGYQRDFSAQASDPKTGLSWESVYTSLREGIVVELARQKSESVGWSTQTPSVLANQPRDRPPTGVAG